MPIAQIDYTKPNAILIYKFETEIDYIHNLKELYKRIKFYFEENNFTDQNGTDDFEFKYWQRDHPGNLQEHQMWWRAYKYAEQSGAPHKLFTYFVKLNYQTVAAKKTEVLHKGKKWGLHKSNTILRCKWYLIENYDSDWNEGILKSFKPKFKNWLYKDKRKLFMGRCYEHAREFQNIIKDYLELVKTQETKPDIYPPNNLP